MILQWDESFDVGSDTLAGVNDADHQPPFPLTAKLNKPTIQVGRPKLSPEDIKKGACPFSCDQTPGASRYPLLRSESRIATDDADRTDFFRVIQSFIKSVLRT
jgi:hypothetical protein